MCLVPQKTGWCTSTATADSSSGATQRRTPPARTPTHEQASHCPRSAPRSLLLSAAGAGGLVPVGTTKLLQCLKSQPGAAPVRELLLEFYTPTTTDAGFQLGESQMLDHLIDPQVAAPCARFLHWLWEYSTLGFVTPRRALRAATPRFVTPRRAPRAAKPSRRVPCG